MLLVCRYTGVPFHVHMHGKSKHFNSLKLPGVHPILERPLYEILRMAEGWSTYDDTEQSILFVALLKATKLVEFSRPAQPTIEVVNKWMEFLIHTVPWIEGVNNTISLPRFRVTENNYTLKSARGLFKEWERHRIEWRNKSAGQQLAEHLRATEERLIRRFRIGFNDFKVLAMWMLKASGAPKGMHDEWIKIFTMKGDTTDKHKVWSISTPDLEEMLGYMEQHLDATSTAARLVFDHLRDLLQLNRDGMKYSIMDKGTTSVVDELQSMINDPTKIITSDGKIGHLVPSMLDTGKDRLKSYEAMLKQLEPSTTPIIVVPDKPIESNYQSRVEYLRANSAYEQAVYAKKIADQEEAKKNAVRDQLLERVTIPPPELEVTELDEVEDIVPSNRKETL